MYRKNVSGQYLYFGMVSATDGSAATGKTVTGKRAIDGAAQASVTGTISEEAGGQYKIALSQADINGNNIGFLFTATGCIPVNICVVTTAADPTDAAAFGLTNLDATISSRLADADYTAPDNATITAIAGYVDTEVAAIKAKTDNLPASPAASGDIPSAATIAGAVWDEARSGHVTAGSFGEGVVVNSSADKTGYSLSTTGIDALFTRQLTESYAADGTAPTVAQALLLTQQMLAEKSVAATTVTVKKLDGTTTAATFTLDDGTSPTSITRAT